jgi:hypothetical protein
MTSINKIQRIIREHFEYINSCKLENLKEIDKFPDAFNQQK